MDAMTTTAAESIARIAKDLASPFSTERGNLSMLRMGAKAVIHELQIEIIMSGRRSMSTVALAERLRKLSKSLDALQSEGK